MFELRCKTCDILALYLYYIYIYCCAYDIYNTTKKVHSTQSVHKRVWMSCGGQYKTTTKNSLNPWNTMQPICGVDIATTATNRQCGGRLVSITAIITTTNDCARRQTIFIDNMYLYRDVHFLISNESSINYDDEIWRCPAHNSPITLYVEFMCAHIWHTAVRTALWIFKNRIFSGWQRYINAWGHASDQHSRLFELYYIYNYIYVYIGI